MRLAPIPAVLLAALFLWTSPAAAAQKPDLAIAAQELAFSPAPPLAGTDLAVTVTVHNLGAVESKPALAAVKVARKAKKVFKTTAAVGAIPPGGAVQIPVVLGAYDEGTYTLIVHDADTIVSDRATFTAIGNGEVSVYTNSRSIGKGDTIVLSGRCSTGAPSVRVVLSGPERFSGGVDLGSFPVSADQTWSFRYTTDLAMPTGIYSVYVSDVPQTTTGSTQFTLGYSS